MTDVAVSIFSDRKQPLPRHSLFLKSRVSGIRYQVFFFFFFWVQLFNPSTHYLKLAHGTRHKSFNFVFAFPGNWKVEQLTEKNLRYSPTDFVESNDQKKEKRQIEIVPINRCCEVIQRGTIMLR